MRYEDDDEDDRRRDRPSRRRRDRDDRDERNDRDDRHDEGDVDAVDAYDDDEYDDRPRRVSRSRPTADDKQMAMFAHLGGILGFVIPLIIWIIKKDTSRFVDDQGKEALNFHLTMLIGHLIGGFTICLHFGLLSMVVWIMSLVFSIMGGMAAGRGEKYRYPITIRFIS